MESLYTRLLALVEQHPDGLRLSEIQASLPDAARRTLQRALKDAVGAGLIVVSGAGRATRYSRFSTGTVPVLASEVPVSPDSRDVLAYVSRPQTGRHPIGYQSEFLEDYQPNRSFYLSEPLRRQLRKMGDTGQAGAPAGTHGRAIFDRLLIDLSWSSSRLEGNTYSRLDTLHLLREGRVATGKQASEAQMILNHKAAVELLVDSAHDVDFDRFTLLNLHGLLSENLLSDSLDEGRLRAQEVFISQSVFRPLGMPRKIEEYFDLLLAKARSIADPFEQSFFVMVHIPYLQPFVDVNKRVSRLAANIPLIRENLCPLTFVGVPEEAYVKAVLGVYEMTRVELLRDVFLWAYERSTREYITIKREMAQPDPVRLRYRQWLRDTVREVVLAVGADAVELIRQAADRHVGATDRESAIALAIEELRGLHEGVLMRYGLRPSDYTRWAKTQQLP